MMLINHFDIGYSLVERSDNFSRSTFLYIEKQQQALQNIQLTALSIIK
jgi:hypothetical protein